MIAQGLDRMLSAAHRLQSDADQKEAALHKAIDFWRVMNEVLDKGTHPELLKKLNHAESEFLNACREAGVIVLEKEEYPLAHA